MSDPLLTDPAIAVLAATPAVLRAMLGPLPEKLSAAPGPHGWCARDVVAHLASRQKPAIIGRIEAILANPNGAIPDVPHELMDPAPFRTRPLLDVLAEFEEGRAEAVALLRMVKPDELSWRGTHSGVGEISISDVIHHVAYHDLVHIAQAAQLTSLPLEPLRGAMRRFQ